MGCCASKPVHEKQPLLEGDHDIYAAHNAGTATATAGSADHDDDLKFEAPIQRANLQPASPQQPRPVSTRQLPPTALALQAAQAAMEQAVVESRKASLPVSEGGDPSAHRERSLSNADEEDEDTMSRTQRKKKQQQLQQQQEQQQAHKEHAKIKPVASTLDSILTAPISTAAAEYKIETPTENYVASNLKPTQAVTEASGPCLRLSLQHMRTSNELIVSIERGANLNGSNSSKSSDLYVKLYLLPDDKKVTKQKTKVITSKGFPEWQESFKFALSTADKNTKTLDLTVWDQERLSKNHLIGRLTFDLKDLAYDAAFMWWYPIQLEADGLKLSTLSAATTPVVVTAPTPTMARAPSPEPSIVSISTVHTAGSPGQARRVSAISPNLAPSIASTTAAELADGNEVDADAVKARFNVVIDFSTATKVLYVTTTIAHVSDQIYGELLIKAHVVPEATGKPHEHKLKSKYFDTTEFNTIKENFQFEVAPSEMHFKSLELFLYQKGLVKDDELARVSILLGEFMSQDLVPVDINHEQVYELKRHVPQDSRGLRGKFRSGKSSRPGSIVSVASAATSLASYAPSTTSVPGEADSTTPKTPTGSIHNVKRDRGQVLLALEYRSVKEELLVDVIEARNLLAADVNGTSDAYAKLYLLPDPQKKTKKKTKIVNASLNPRFNESFNFISIASDELNKKMLQVTLQDHDRLSKNDFLGQVTLNLNDIQPNVRTEKWYDLGESFHGNIKLQLKYDDTSHELAVTVKEAKDLIPIRANGVVDPYVKLYLLPDKKKASKQKTKAVKNSTRPTYNETLKYTLNPATDSQRVLQVSVWDNEGSFSHDPLGQCEIPLSVIMEEHSMSEWFALVRDD